MTKVSVIVPVFNVEKYLEKCLNSLVNQTLDEVEILVINDGSTDGSQKIIDKFQQNFPQKIQSFTKENGGLSDARNFGLDKATGNYIGFVDSDDYVSENMFEEMIDLAEKHSAEMVICNLQKVDEMGKNTQQLTQIPHLPEGINLKENFDVFADLSYFACNKIFRKDLFNDLRFKKSRHFEDIELIPKLLLKCTTLAQTQSFYYQYLERTDSISKTHTLKGLDILKAVNDVSEDFKNSKYSGHKSTLKNFKILEGVYTFLAYSAFVKDEFVAEKLHNAYCEFVKENKITVREILFYRRFGKNYLLSLPLTKIIYYVLYFFGFNKLTQIFIKKI
ncbi:glycosyltransferase family 2 protein [Halpernia frigidisoli]|uniref:Glycosyltransferase involved in cell wall bisynthesis n=1 Tax=Halpernia frigidisoli TaxID=1125876 RepID=A0A1I3I714_9FLAO|nr:glycosyltransferase [Halpernia frigidisoli]SFI43657.1 Glycosyltransferase involved in cell wall bisynthesis [Halpernia frigidisoli]